MEGKGGGGGGAGEILGKLPVLAGSGGGCGISNGREEGVGISEKLDSDLKLPSRCDSPSSLTRMLPEEISSSV